MIFKYTPPPPPPQLGDYYTRFALLPVRLQNKNTVWLEKYYIVKAKEYLDDYYAYYERWQKVSQSDFLEFREEQMKEDIPAYSELRIGGQLVNIVQDKRVTSDF